MCVGALKSFDCRLDLRVWVTFLSQISSLIWVSPFSWSTPYLIHFPRIFHDIPSRYWGTPMTSEPPIHQSDQPSPSTPGLLQPLWSEMSRGWPVALLRRRCAWGLVWWQVLSSQLGLEMDRSFYNYGIRNCISWVGLQLWWNLAQLLWFHCIRKSTIPFLAFFCPMPWVISISGGRGGAGADSSGSAFALPATERPRHRGRVEGRWVRTCVGSGDGWWWIGYQVGGLRKLDAFLSSLFFEAKSQEGLSVRLRWSTIPNDWECGMNKTSFFLHERSGAFRIVASL